MKLAPPQDGYRQDLEMRGLAALVESLTPRREQLARHPMYTNLGQPESVQVFMEHHVFAVWDFMSLLKRLQREVTCVAIPWVPVGSPATRRFVNLLVAEEESDQLDDGTIASHFELYLAGMREAGAATDPIETFLSDIKSGVSVEEALCGKEIPPAAACFVKSTWEWAQQSSLPAVASAFFFGREELIPQMFQPILDCSQDRPDMRIFRAYLVRHLELDGGHHGEMAGALVSQLCGNDSASWNEAKNAAEASLMSRKALWDGVAGILAE